MPSDLSPPPPCMPPRSPPPCIQSDLRPKQLKTYLPPAHLKQHYTAFPLRGSIDSSTGTTAQEPQFVLRGSVGSHVCGLACINNVCTYTQGVYPRINITSIPNNTLSPGKGVPNFTSTAFHLQTDGKTERVNQELEQHLCVFCNFQQDNWAELIPFMEFAHNVQQHSATKKSPFKVWYGYKPEFIPPIHFSTRILAAEDRLNTLNQIRSEVTSALKVAAEVMRNSKSPTMFQEFKIGDLVWLEGTNIHTTHPKAKLALRQHGPFQILSTWGVNCKLQLPKSWHIHPVFHNSLISPYHENTTHGPNFT